MLERIQSPVTALVLTLACLAAPPVSALDLDLVQTLAGELGVTETQAAGGAASVLGLAKANLTSDDYLSLVEAVPEVGDLLAKESTASAADAVGNALSALSKADEEESEETLQAPASVESIASALMEEGDEGTDATLAAAASALGAKVGADDTLSKAAGLASLADSFSDLGLDSDMIGKFVPVILEYVGGKGGDSKAALLKKALGLL
jgi:hypothetical protein